MEMQLNVDNTMNETMKSEVVDNRLEETQDYLTIGYLENDESYQEESEKGNSIAFFITIGICVVVGIVLGIIFGRKSALK